jgi:formate C-acetyltransferase
LATLNDGYDPYSGKTFCSGCGEFEAFDTFEELMSAWKKQVQFYTKATIMIDTAIDMALEVNVPDVICSALV